MRLPALVHRLALLHDSAMSLESPHHHYIAKVLADWSAGRDLSIILFGSRVRGDHRPDSDVDVLIAWNFVRDEDLEWWLPQQEDDFPDLNASLPGRLHILEDNEPVAGAVRSAAATPFHLDRNVICVWRPPKSSAGACA
jgi:predicted nucleotidyltransferase